MTKCLVLRWRVRGLHWYEGRARRSIALLSTGSMDGQRAGTCPKSVEYWIEGVPCAQ